MNLYALLVPKNLIDKILKIVFYVCPFLTYQVEKSFIYDDGLYKRKYVKHVLFAPEMHNAYGASIFPGISDAIFDAKSSGDVIEVKKQISAVLECLLQAKIALEPTSKEI